MGIKPLYPVTGYLPNHYLKTQFVPVSGVEPLFRAYESLVLAVELHRRRFQYNNKALIWQILF